jgi:hypothetical protein
MEQEKKRKIINKVVIVGVIALGIVAFRYFDLGQYLTLEYIKGSQEKFQALYLSDRFLVIATYMGIYIAVTALSLPGAAVLTLAGGGLFGLVVGTVVVSFASTIGASLACLVARFLLREWVQNRFGDKLKTINQRHRKGRRLLPFFPSSGADFSVFCDQPAHGAHPHAPVHLSSGFRRSACLPGPSSMSMPAKSWPRSIPCPASCRRGYLVSFAVLGLFPITVKKLLAAYKSKFKVDAESTGATNV